MSPSLQRAVESAHIAYKTHVGTLKWREKQLHGLVKIVCENRDQLYADLSQCMCKRESCLQTTADHEHSPVNHTPAVRA